MFSPASTQICRRCGVIELKQLHEDIVRGGDHDVAPPVMLTHAVARDDAVSLSRCHTSRRPATLTPKTAYGAAAAVLLGSLVHVQAPATYPEQDIS